MIRKFTWQKSYQTLPPNIVQAVESLEGNDLVVACQKSISREEIIAGKYTHLSIAWNGDAPTFSSSVLPDPENGNYSRWNRYGREKVRKDLPMHQKEYSMETPNFGDWSYGSHTVTQVRDVYHRDEYPAKLLPITIELIGQDIIKGKYIFKFTLEEVLTKGTKHFDHNLFFNINLLQENTGNTGIHPSGLSAEEYLKTLYVNWEIFPPGEREETIARILTGLNTSDPKVKADLIERHDYLVRMKPLNFVKGINGFHKYFGAMFAEDLVVFENVEYGNAIYILLEDWKELSKLSRTELLSSASANFIRIPHTKSWKKRLRAEVAREKMKRKRRPTS